MAPIDIKCPECGAIQMIDDDRLGETIKCPKCRFDFVAEAGDEYEIAGDKGLSHPTPDADADPPPRAASKKPAKPPKPKVETEAQRQLRERMEKWAED